MLSPLIRLLISETGLLPDHTVGHVAVIRQNASDWPTRLEQPIGCGKWTARHEVGKRQPDAVCHYRGATLVILGSGYSEQYRACPSSSASYRREIAQAPPSHPSFSNVSTQLYEDMKLFGHKLQEPPERHAES